MENIKAGYYPLVVSSISFKVMFQLQPYCDVVVEGERPTEEEFFKATNAMMLPVVVAQALYVATVFAFEKSIKE